MVRQIKKDPRLPAGVLIIFAFFILSFAPPVEETVGHTVASAPVYEPEAFSWYDPADDPDASAPVQAVVVTPSPTIRTPKPRPKATPRPLRVSSKPAITSRPRLNGKNVRGYATYFATGTDGQYGAAGPVLRRALNQKYGEWRGHRVLVCKKDRCLEVKLNDWCACGPRNGEPTLIDLSDEAFRWLAPLSRGVIHVRISY